MRKFVLLALTVVVTSAATAVGTVWIWVKAQTPSLTWVDAQSRVTIIRYALEDFKTDHGRYPAAEEGLKALIGEPPLDRPGSRYFSKRYLNAADDLVDSWGRPIFYAVAEHPDQGCVVYSFGEDGLPDGVRDDEDILRYCVSGNLTP